MRDRLRRILIGSAMILAVALPAVATAGGPGDDRQAGAPRTGEDIFPPWQHGANNDVASRGLSFTVPDVDNLPDFHGNPIDPKLVLYVGGNYFFAMAPLVQAFEKAHPDSSGRIYWETLPPGLLAKQTRPAVP